MSFRLVPKSMTLNDLEWRIGRNYRYFREISSIQNGLHKEDIPKLSAMEM